MQRRAKFLRRMSLFSLLIPLGLFIPSEGITLANWSQVDFQITYSTQRPTNQPVVAQIETLGGAQWNLINNDGRSSYTFKENGKFTFEYENWLGQQAQKTLTVDWIDQQPSIAELQNPPEPKILPQSLSLKLYDTDVTHYRFQYNGAEWSEPQLIEQPLGMENSQLGQQELKFIARDAVGNWQSQENATVYRWEVVSHHQIRERMTTPEQGHKAIEISIGEQHLWAYEGDQVVFHTPVTTGRYGLYTTPGDFSITQKSLNKSLLGGFRSDYWMRFNGGMGIHDAKWRADWEFGSDIWTWKGSSGCVNTPLEASRWLYDWSEVGLPVKVYE